MPRVTPAFVAACVFAAMLLLYTQSLLARDKEREDYVLDLGTKLREKGKEMQDLLRHLHDDEKEIDRLRLLLAQGAGGKSSLGRPPSPEKVVQPAPAVSPQARLSPQPVKEIAPSKEVVPVLIMACCRADYLERTLRNVESHLRQGYEIVVSQDGFDNSVRSLMATSFSNVKFIKHENTAPLEKNSPGEGDVYYKIARHYGWALGQAFSMFPKAPFVVVLEDDLEVSPDFFDFFEATWPIVEQDATIWAVSAWNDNGFEENIADPAAVYRTDVFPGLGWLMPRRLWDELGPQWPKGYWDDWMRTPKIRRDRVTLRPEVSRTATFGKSGSSSVGGGGGSSASLMFANWRIIDGQFFETHLGRIKANTVPVNFKNRDLSYLIKDRYDAQLNDKLKRALRVSVSDIASHSGALLRIDYSNFGEFQNIARAMRLMDDEKEGIPRTAYRGVVEVKAGGGSKNTVLIAPSNI